MPAAHTRYTPSQLCERTNSSVAYGSTAVTKKRISTVVDRGTRHSHLHANGVGAGRGADDSDTGQCVGENSDSAGGQLHARRRSTSSTRVDCCCTRCANDGGNKWRAQETRASESDVAQPCIMWKMLCEMKRSESARKQQEKVRGENIFVASGVFHLLLFFCVIMANPAV